MTDIQWSDQQRNALAAIESGKNVLVTGFAGTGKSTLLNHVRETADKLAVTATTGVAAVNVRGNTVHRWAGLGIGRDTAAAIAKRLRKNRQAFKRLKNTDTLAIDEISMLSAKMVDLLSGVLERVRNNADPFGGMQVVCFGDFLQLPPVQMDREGGWAFEAEAWGNFTTAMLDEPFRQDDQEFIDFLSHVRMGDVSDFVQDFLNCRRSSEGLTGRPVAVYTHNVDVDDRNLEEFKRLKTPKRTYEAEYTGDPKECEFLQKQVLAPDTLHLRPQARVMLLWNINPRKGLANGSTGTVIDCHEGFVTVEFDCGETREIREETWERYDDYGDVSGTKTQIPLRLAYAATAHKCQGMQFDNMEVDISRCFSPGQAYVALSRAKRPEGLVVTDWDESCIFADEKALGFYGYPSKGFRA